jgi:hypothetical protein
VVVRSEKVNSIKQMHGQRDLVLTGKAQENYKGENDEGGRKEGETSQEQALVLEV